MKKFCPSRHQTATIAGLMLLPILASAAIAANNTNFESNVIIDGSLTVLGSSISLPSVSLQGTNNSGTLTVTSSLAQATTYTLPDPGSASDGVVDTKAVQSITGAKTFASGALLSSVGTGTATIAPAGRLFSLSATTASSTGGATNTTYTLPANTLTTTGAGIRVKIHGTTASNSNSKACNFLFGSAPVTITLPLSTGSGKDFSADILIYRTGASTQQISVIASANAALCNNLSTTASATETSSIAMELNLPTSTGAADVTVDEFTITAEP